MKDYTDLVADMWNAYGADPERVLKDAMWAGDSETLQQVARCICCCADHTFTTGCPAYAWGGCRGQGTMSPDDMGGWAAHYAKHHGLSPERFYGFDG